jgi:hypothetical protein
MGPISLLRNLSTLAMLQGLLNSRARQAYLRLTLPFLKHLVLESSHRQCTTDQYVIPYSFSVGIMMQYLHSSLAALLILTCTCVTVLPLAPGSPPCLPLLFPSHLTSHLTTSSPLDLHHPLAPLSCVLSAVMKFVSKNRYHGTKVIFCTQHALSRKYIFC